MQSQHESKTLLLEQYSRLLTQQQQYKRQDKNCLSSTRNNANVISWSWTWAKSFHTENLPTKNPVSQLNALHNEITALD